MIFPPLHFALSFVASVLRLGAGAPAAPVETREPLTLYEFEGCPYCRVAREAVSASGVAVLVRPCPKGGKRFRPSVRNLGGMAQFPFLIDPNTDVTMYESAHIAAYLRKTYGPAPRPFMHWLGPLNVIASQFGVLVRLAAGTFVKRSRAPQQPLEFFGAERNPGARLVKELLCEMELAYLWRSAPPAGETAPYLSDPNTGEAMRGARAIRRYLRETYRS